MIIPVSDPGPVVIVTLQGELDLAQARDLRHALMAACSRAGRLVVVDLLRVTFVDSTILGVLVGTRKRLEPGCRIVVVNAAPIVMRVMRITGLLEALGAHAPDEPLDEEVAQAVEAARERRGLVTSR